LGKKLSDEEIARYERDGFVFPVEAFSPTEADGYLDRPARQRSRQLKSGSRLSPLAQAALALTASGEALLRREPGRRVGLALLGLGIVLVLGGCAARDQTSDENRRGGFYGTVSGGMSHP
jgi:hypothetical protein